jgi:hypothetical protein
MAQRRKFVLAVGLSGAAGLALLAAERALCAPRRRGQADSHFDGKRFRSIEPLDHGLKDLLAWMTSRERSLWRDFTDTPPGAPPPDRVARGLRVTFVNHSTVLVQMDGVNILTDPIWSERVSPVSWAGPRRHRPPGIRFEDLPPVDAVLAATITTTTWTCRRCAVSRPRTIRLGNSAFLAARGLARSRDLDSSGPRSNAVVRLGRDRSLRILLFRRRHRLGLAFPADPRTLSGLRLALLPIGACRPRWFMSQAHIDPEEALRAQQVLGAETAVAIHFGTFAQVDDGESEPLEALAAALARRPNPRLRFLALDNGQSLELTALAPGITTAR